MATFNKFNCFTQDVGRKLHDLNGDTLKVMLTNTAPVATNAVKTDITEISAGNGYTAGGTSVGTHDYTQTSGVGKLTVSADLVFTASGGSFAAARYAVLYNSTAAGNNLIGWWDYGSSITLATGETLTVDFDQTNGVLTLT